MKIQAVWERPVAHPRYGSTFFLLDTDELIHVCHAREFLGTDAAGKRLYREIGLEQSPAFNDEDRFDFAKADAWVRHFGGRLLARFDVPV